MDETDVIYALRVIKRVFEDHNIKYWLDCGTLLGAVRENRIIPWDHDVDIGVYKKSSVIRVCTQLPSPFKYRHLDYFFSLNKDVDDIIFEKFIPKITIEYKSCVLSVQLYNSEERMLTRRVMPYVTDSTITKRLRWLIMDLLQKNSGNKRLPGHVLILKKAFYRLPTKLRNKIIENLILLYDEFSTSGIHFSIPKHFVENLSTITLYNMEFPAPSPVEEYLEYRYGEDWKTPKKDYVYYEDDQSIIEED